MRSTNRNETFLDKEGAFVIESDQIRNSCFEVLVLFGTAVAEARIFAYNLIE